jgi:hypothetical protein
LVADTHRAPIAPLNAASKGTIAAMPEPDALPDDFCADAFTELWRLFSAIDLWPLASTDELLDVHDRLNYPSNKERSNY